MKEENILEKTEMRMLRRIKGVTVKDKVKSEDIRKELGVGSIKSKARESRLRWFGHKHRKEQESNLRKVMDMEIPGRRPRARLLESAGILPFSCQERRGDDSPGWRQARPTVVGWEGGWGYAVTGQLSDSVRHR